MITMQERWNFAEDGKILYIVTGHSEKISGDFYFKKPGDISTGRNALKTEGCDIRTDCPHRKGYFLFTRERWNDKLEKRKKGISLVLAGKLQPGRRNWKRSLQAH